MMFMQDNPPFDGEQAQMLIRLGLNRIRLQKKKKTEANEGSKREVARLLQESKREQARIKAMGVIHEDYLLEIMTITELYLERVALRMDVIAAQTSCPLDIMEHVAGVCYIAPFLSSVDELLKLRDAFVRKYGKNFVSECMECKCISPKVLDRLSRAPPTEALVDFYLGTIAMKFEIEWEASGLTDVDDDLFDPLIIEEPINEDAYQAELQEAEGEKEDPLTELDRLEFPSHSHRAPEVEKGIEGVLKADMKGNFWVLDTPNTSNPIFIPANSRLNARSGDRVSVVLDERRDSKRSGKIVAILPPEHPRQHIQHHPQQQIHHSQHMNGYQQPSTQSQYPYQQFPPDHPRGKLKFDNNKNAWIAYNRGDGNEMLVYVAPSQLNGACEGSQVSFVFHERSDGKLSGSVVAVLDQLDGDMMFGMSYAPPPQQRPELMTNSAQAIGGLSPPTQHNAGLGPPIVTGPVIGLAQSAINAPTFIRREGDIMCDINGHHWLQLKDDNGVVHWNSSIQSPDTCEFIYIAPEDLNGTQNGDSVAVEVAPTPFPGTNCFSARVIQLLATSTEFKTVQIVGTVTVDELDEGGFLFNRETSEVVFIPHEWLNGAEDGDMALVESRMMPPSHPHINRAQWEGHVLTVIEKGKMQFETILHVTPSYNYEESGEGWIGWVSHPNNPYQRIIVPFQLFNGAQDQDRVTVATSQQHGHIIGQITCIHGSARDFDDAVAPMASHSQDDKTTPSSLSQWSANLLDPIIIECGDSTTRCGIHAVDGKLSTPSITEPSVVGRPIFSPSQAPHLATDNVIYVGNDCLSRSGILKLSFPMEDGLVTNWDDLEHLLRHLLITKLQCDPSKHPVLLALGNRGNDLPLEDKQQIYRILFRTFNVPVTCIQPKWSLYPFAFFADTFLVVDIKENATTVLPIIDKQPQYDSMVIGHVGGSQITSFLTRLLTVEGLGTFESVSEKQIVKMIKEKHSFISPSPDEEVSGEVRYELPDGQEIVIPLKVLGHCGEILFKPSLVGAPDSASIPRLVKQALDTTREEAQSILSVNILLCGGTAKLRGLKERVEAELEQTLPQHLLPQILDNSFLEPSDVIYRGGVAFVRADQPTLWKTQADFEAAHSTH